MFNNFSEDKPKPRLQEVEIKDLQKDEVQGKRNPKKKDKDYQKKYGDREDNWN
jgi:hypothetical protein